jgi:hypothetical protein
VKKLIILGGILGTCCLVSNLSPADFMSTACRAEAEALHRRSESINRDFLIIRDSYTVAGRVRAGVLDEVEQRQSRYLADLDTFDRQCN